MTGSTPAEITTLIVDDHEVVREGLRLSLSRAPHIRVVGEAADGAAAVDLALRRRPMVVIMDVRMPGIDGLEATRRLAEVLPETKVLIFTAYSERSLLGRGFEWGAKGYVLKEAPHSTLVRAIEKVAAGDGFVDPALMPQFLAGRDQNELLTAREREILQLLADGLSNGDVAERLFISQETVKSHVRHILTKLEADTRTQAVAIALREAIIDGGARRRRESRPAPLRVNAAPTSGQPPRSAALVLDVVLGRVVGELVDGRHALVERGVDADERLPLLGQRVLGEDRLDRALRLAGPAVDALLGVDHEHPRRDVDAVDRADVDAGLILDVDAGLGDHVGHRDLLYRRQKPSISSDGRSKSADFTTTWSKPAAWARRSPAVSVWFVKPSSGTSGYVSGDVVGVDPRDVDDHEVGRVDPLAWR